MKIIFLDFDGVIRLPIQTGGPRIEAEFSSEKMKRVATLARESDAKIVVSSDWRHRYDWGGMADLLEPHIPRDLLHSDWMIPILASAHPDSMIVTAIPRGAEILSWLARNPDVSDFVILDDMHSKQFPLMKERLVTCQLLDGFTDERLSKARSILLGGSR